MAYYNIYYFFMSVYLLLVLVLVRKFSFYTFWVLLRNEFYPQWSLFS